MSIQEETFSVSITEYIITDLPPNTRCCITIVTGATCDGITRNSTTGTEVCAVTSSGPPGPVGNLQVFPSSPFSVLVTWEPPLNYSAPDVQYNATIFENGEQDGDDVLVAQVTVIDQLYYYFVGLEQNREYYVSVMPFTDAYEDNLAVDKTVTTLPTVPPSPTNVLINMTGETLLVSWTDEFSANYSVLEYTVVASCNNDLFNATTEDTTVAIIVGEPSGNVWCTARVQSVNDVGPGDFSLWIQAIFPLMIPLEPQCFLTEEVGNMAVISFTLTAPYALEYLTFDYSFANETVNVSETDRWFNGTNSLSFTELSRNVQYRFMLRLCDSNPILSDKRCGNSCMLNFFPSQVGVVSGCGQYLLVLKLLFGLG